MTSIAGAEKSPTCVENTGNCLFWYFAGLATLTSHPVSIMAIQGFEVCQTERSEHVPDPYQICALHRQLSFLPQAGFSFPCGVATCQYDAPGVICITTPSSNIQVHRPVLGK